MKDYWQRLQLRIDALSLRERAMAFAITALALVTLVNTFVLDALWGKQKQLSQQITLDQQQIAAIQADIQARVKSTEIDPDANNRVHLQNLKQQSARMREQLTGAQNGLVAPDRMAALLEELLKRNGRLHLVSLKTLPATLATGPGQQGIGNRENSVQPAGTGGGAKPGPEGALNAVYKHGVEVVVQGGYSDILQYLSQLEAMPWQLFWDGASLQVEQYPKNTLILHLYTLSLDKKWLNI